MSWSPLLTGEAMERAEEAVSSISDDLREPQPDAKGYSLSSGYTGIALFFGYLSAVRSDEELADLAGDYLSKAIDSVATDTSPALGLFAGLSGLAWTWHHLIRLLDGEGSADTQELDEVILDAVRSAPWRFEWDLVYGLSGIGLYALHHSNPIFAREAVTAIVARLTELAIECSQGVAWKTPPEFMNPRNAQQYPQGRFDQGVAHGVPGVIGFLASAYKRKLVDGTGLKLLDGALSWLHANMRPEDGGSRFTYFPPEMSDARSGWCYGDPGVSAVLLGVDRDVAGISCRDLAVTVACHAAGRPIESSGVIDATLCHGAAGLGHIYNRLFQATGEGRLATAAKLWFEEALAMRRPGQGIGGYLNWWPEIQEWRPESGLLVGSAGIGLSLLASISAVEPLWDTLFLLPAPKNNSSLRQWRGC